MVRSDWFHYCVIVCAIDSIPVDQVFAFSCYNLEAKGNCYRACPVTVTKFRCGHPLNGSGKRLSNLGRESGICTDKMTRCQNKNNKNHPATPMVQICGDHLAQNPHW